jgi:hypothetical protein
MTKIIKEMLPPDVRVAKDAQDLLVECCVGELFICVICDLWVSHFYTVANLVLFQMNVAKPRVVFGVLILMWRLVDTEFINLISSESNEICSKEEKRTIAPEHVLRALEVRSRLPHFSYFRFSFGHYRSGFVLRASAVCFSERTRCSLFRYRVPFFHQ